jgi:SAM-dependent methyltransferase
MTTTIDAPVDMAEVEAFGGKMLDILNGGATALMLSVGHRLGLFDTMAGMPPATATGIATEAGLQERYVREWLGAMVTAGIVHYDHTSDEYRLPPAHAALTTRAAGPNNFASYMQFIPLVAVVEDELLDKFRNGGGVPYSSYPRFHQAMAEISGAVFDASLVSAVLPLVPGAVEQLEAGIDVADVGTGSGHAVNVMAQAFPASRFVGYDFSADALAVGRAEASRLGLRNASFEERDAATLDGSRQFDLMTTFDAVHDQADPRAMVAGIFASLKPGGHWLCVDIQASSHIGENVHHPLGPFGYTVSCMHCMTVSLAYGGVGLGAMWGIQQARQLFTDVGFEKIQVHTMEGDPMNNYYVCRKPA